MIDITLSSSGLTVYHNIIVIKNINNKRVIFLIWKYELKFNVTLKLYVVQELQ